MFAIFAVVSILSNPQYLVSAQQFETKQACIDAIPAVRAALEHEASKHKGVSVGRVICYPVDKAHQKVSEGEKGLDCMDTQWGWPRACQSRIRVSGGDGKAEFQFAFDITWRF